MSKITEDIKLRNKNFVFMDRAHAGELLADLLKQTLKSFKNCIVLVIPSGGIPLGKIISGALGIPLDFIIVRKIPIPHNPEAGFGSVSWDGDVFLNERLIRQHSLTDAEIEASVADAKNKLARRILKFRGKKPLPDLNGKTLILVDDGLASGYTMLSAIGSIRKYSPGRIIVAVPTGSNSAIELVNPHIDELFCLNVRETAQFAVADAYQEWHDLTEQEVIKTIGDIGQ